MIWAGRCRSLINRDIHRVRAMFRWAASQKLYPGAAYFELKTVESLKEGRTEAKDDPPVPPVAESIIKATLPQFSRQAAAMVRLQLLTAARPAEIITMRPRDVDRTDPGCWVYRPASYKT